VSDLLPLYREMAAGGGNFHGLSVMQHAKQIGKLIKEHKIATVLDFGCGRGDAYRSPHKLHHTWGIPRRNLQLYDPSFPGVDKKPERRFDLVLCSDVLEHIPEEDVQRFIGDLFNHAKVHVWASVCCRAAKKTFPTTGENLHVTVKPFQWWHDTFAEVCPLFPTVTFTLIETP
jgi:hypothetical protein